MFHAEHDSSGYGHLNKNYLLFEDKRTLKTIEQGSYKMRYNVDYIEYERTIEAFYELTGVLGTTRGFSDHVTQLCVPPPSSDHYKSSQLKFPSTMNVKYIM